jgi:acyl carrier protein
MAESKDSLDRVELVVAVEEVLGVQLPYDDS